MIFHFIGNDGLLLALTSNTRQSCFHFSVEHKFSWRYFGGLLGRRSKISQKVVNLKFPRTRFKCSALNNLLQWFHKIFNHSIALRPVWCYFLMSKAKVLCEFWKLRTSECRTVVSFDIVWYSECRKYLFQLWDDMISINSRQYFNFWKSAILVNDYKQVFFVLEWSTQVNSNILPRSSWEFRWIKRHFDSRIRHQLASRTALDNIFYFLV